MLRAQSAQVRREASGARGGAARARRPEADLAGALEQRGEHREDEAADDDVEDAGEVDEAQRALRLLRALRAALALVHPPQALQLRAEPMHSWRFTTLASTKARTPSRGTRSRASSGWPGSPALCMSRQQHTVHVLV